jgi:competence protein ComFC
MARAWGALGASACAGCGAPRTLLCDDCRQTLQHLPIDPTPGMDRALAAFRYAGGARSLLLDLKLKGRRCAAEPLVAGMCDAVYRHGLIGEALTFVPGRRADVARRGYDHAEVLARAMGRRLGLPVLDSLRRRTEPPDQASLSAAQRWPNQKGAFAARAVPERVVLVDDLLTTGATGGACALALRTAGAVHVEAVVACRA